MLLCWLGFLVVFSYIFIVPFSGISMRDFDFRSAYDGRESEPQFIAITVRPPEEKDLAVQSDFPDTDIHRLVKRFAGVPLPQSMLSGEWDANYGLRDMVESARYARGLYEEMPLDGVLRRAYPDFGAFMAGLERGELTLDSAPAPTPGSTGEGGGAGASDSAPVDK